MIPRYKLEKLLGISYPTLAMFLDMADFEYGKNQGILRNKRNKDLLIKVIKHHLAHLRYKPKQAERYAKALEIVKQLEWE